LSDIQPMRFPYGTVSCELILLQKQTCSGSGHQCAIQQSIHFDIESRTSRPRPVRRRSLYRQRSGLLHIANVCPASHLARHEMRRIRAMLTGPCEICSGACTQDSAESGHLVERTYTWNQEHGCFVDLVHASCTELGERHSDQHSHPNPCATDLPVVERMTGCTS
jgi:hypothetical protein